MIDSSKQPHGPMLRGVRDDASDVQPLSTLDTRAEAIASSTETAVPEAASERPIGPFSRMESVSDVFMRANGANGFVEVQQEGQIIALSDLAAINDWSEHHDASPLDRERLVALGIQATHTLHASHQQEKTMEAASQNTQATARRIGENMPKPDWQMSIDLLKARAPGERASVYIPKAGAEYGGQVLLVTDTHIVQRVGKSTAIAHDLNALENGRPLSDAIDAGQIKPGTHMKFQYGDDRGTGTAIPFNQKRSEEIKAEMTAWAKEHITNAKGRETFLKHVDAATKNMAQSVSKERPQAPQGAPTRAPQRDR
ncbi:KfrB domain-containing protein [Variovorax ginsengisoli]|uniref:KfrB domain-containing protein n=1 Tax=Variovorax ginsengisoli TaxID=363844 RepID=A0ABT9SF27_9BURK|nr:hypothetical protein [Variovorax ginsengisoli]MDP9902388.1 hypothetical protein [Variovorax ginsengisoli]